VKRWVASRNKTNPVELLCTIKIEPLSSLLNGRSQESIERVTREYLSGPEFIDCSSPSFQQLEWLLDGIGHLTATKRDEVVRLSERIREGEIAGSLRETCIKSHYRRQV